MEYEFTNKYLLKYAAICNKYSKPTKIIKGYAESHHIFPVCLFGKNKQKVKVPYRVHVILHYLIWKAYKKEYGQNHFKSMKMATAFASMAMRSKLTNDRKVHSLKMLELMRIADKEGKSGRIITEQTRKKNITASIHARGANVGKHNGMFGKIHSAETKAKISLATQARLTTEKFKLNKLTSEQRKQNAIKSSKTKTGVSVPKKLQEAQIFELLNLYKSRVFENWFKPNTRFNGGAITSYESMLCTALAPKFKCTKENLYNHLKLKTVVAKKVWNELHSQQ